MIKICMVKENMTIMDGVVRVLELLSEEFVQEYEVHMISICGRVSQMQATFSPKCHFRILKEGNLPLKDTIVSGAAELRKYLKKHNIDIVFSVGGSSLPVSILATRGMKIKTVFCEHINFVAASRDKTDRVIRKLLVPFTNRIVTLTEQDREVYLKNFSKRKESEVVSIHNWVDEKLLTESVSYNMQSKKIITVGRICEQKGYKELLDIAEQIFKQYPMWRWDIYGSGPQFEEIQKEIVERKLENYVVMMGNCKDIYKRYSEYAFYAMTSKYEGLPMVLLEAKAKGLPVISYDCMTGPKEIVRDEIDGFLIPMGDKEEFALKAMRLMEDEALRQRFSVEAKHNLGKFKKEKIMEQWRKLIFDLEDIKGD